MNQFWIGVLTGGGIVAVLAIIVAIVYSYVDDNIGGYWS